MAGKIKPHGGVETPPYRIRERDAPPAVRGRAVSTNLTQKFQQFFRFAAYNKNRTAYEKEAFHDNG